MCKSLVLATMILTLGMGAAALARDDGESCHRLGQMEISIDAMKQKIDDLGYDVCHIEAERGCFEVEIIDRGTGGGVKAMFSRASGGFSGPSWRPDLSHMGVPRSLSAPGTPR